jgi:hypothetical protein
VNTRPSPIDFTDPRIVFRFSCEFLHGDPLVGRITEAIGLHVIKQGQPNPYQARLTKLGKERWKLSTGFMDYSHGRLSMINTMRWLAESSKTDSHCGMVLDFSAFDGKNNVTYRVDPMKTVLGFDDRLALESFSETSHAPQSMRTAIDRLNMSQSSPIYGCGISLGSEHGTDFTRVKDGYVRVKYIGGESYPQKLSEGLAIVESIAKCISEGYRSPGVYNESERSTFIRMVSESTSIKGSCADYQTFRQRYPEMRLRTNMSDNPRELSAMFNRFKPLLISLLEGCEIDGNEAEINYDSDRGMLQIKEAKLTVKSIERIDLLDCTIKGGRLHKCQLFECECKSSTLSCCYTKETSVKNCTAVDCYLDLFSEINESIIDGRITEIKCSVEKSAIRNGRIGKRAKIDALTEIYENVTKEQ